MEGKVTLIAGNVSHIVKFNRKVYFILRILSVLFNIQSAHALEIYSGTKSDNSYIENK